MTDFPLQNLSGEHTLRPSGIPTQSKNTSFVDNPIKDSFGQSKDRIHQSSHIESKRQQNAASLKMDLKKDKTPLKIEPESKTKAQSPRKRLVNGISRNVFGTENELKGKIIAVDQHGSAYIKSAVKPRLPPSKRSLSSIPESDEKSTHEKSSSIIAVDFSGIGHILSTNKKLDVQVEGSQKSSSPEFQPSQVKVDKKEGFSNMSHNTPRVSRETLKSTPERLEFAGIQNGSMQLKKPFEIKGHSQENGNLIPEGSGGFSWLFGSAEIQEKGTEIEESRQENILANDDFSESKEALSYRYKAPVKKTVINLGIGSSSPVQQVIPKAEKNYVQGVEDDVESFRYESRSAPFKVQSRTIDFAR